jgi:gamma-glutamyl hydrolase
MTLNANAASTAEPADAKIPVIAVISQPATTYNSKWPEATHNWSEVVGSYVDWIEQTGAETALVPFDMPWNVMEQVLGQTQGMVLPGGAAELVDEHHKTTEYQNRISRILRWVQYQNNNGIYYPVWGTCLGMESLMIHFNNNDGSMLQDGFDDKSQYHKVE